MVLMICTLTHIVVFLGTTPILLQSRSSIGSIATGFIHTGAHLAVKMVKRILMNMDLQSECIQRVSRTCLLYKYQGPECQAQTQHVVLIAVALLDSLVH